LGLDTVFLTLAYALGAAVPTGTSASTWTVACSVPKLTVAPTPSSLFSLFSTRAAQEAQVGARRL